MHRFVYRGAEGTIPGVDPALAPLLLARGVATPEEAEAFLHPRREDLTDPFLLSGMKEACALIREAIASRTPITVYGDYDCDGVCAAAILLETLRALGAHADVYLPDRKREGYGLNEAAVRRIAAASGLLITVDCGVTALEEVALAKTLGLRVIITDHHTFAQALPDCDALLHPLRGAPAADALCGAGVAYKLCCALLGSYCPEALELAALATIADMVPLLRENRVIAALGLRLLPQTRRPGLRALLRLAGIDGEVTGTQAAFQLAPRMNACGRMASASLALELLTTGDPARGEELAAQADRLNAGRKSVEQHMLEEAEAQVQSMDLCALRAIVVAGEGWDSGVVGLVAGRLAERYGYPTAALAIQGESATGSARSACGVDLYAALDSCRDLFSRFGGHRQAAGLTIAAAQIETLRQRFSDAVAQALNGRALMPETPYDGALSLQSITLPLIESLRALEPFGMGNPAPVYLLENAEILAARAVGAAQAHLKLTLAQDGATLDAIAFRMGARAATLHGACQLAVTPVSNTFRGQTRAECRVEAIGRAQRRFPADPDAEARDVLQEFIRLCRIPTTGAADGSALPAPEGAQGTLYLCRTAETAAALCARFPLLDVLPQDESVEPRAYHALYRCAFMTARGPYRHVVLCDGALCPQELALARSLYPRARVTALPQSAALRGRLEALRFSIDELRAFYRRVRRGEAPGRTPKEAAMGALLVAVDLLDAALRPLPAHPCNPAAHPLFRLLQGGEC